MPVYSREIKSAPVSPVSDGRPVFGTFSGPFRTFNIRGIKRPFGDLPLPAFLTDWRVMEILRFYFCDSSYIGEIELFDGGYFSFMETVLWNRKTGRRFAYRRLLPPSFMQLPHKPASSITACRTRKRYLRILTRLEKHHLLADFDFVGSDHRPPLSGHLEMHVTSDASVCMSTVTPWEVRRRCEAAMQTAGPLDGFINTGFEVHEIDPSGGVGYFDVRQAHYSLRTKSSLVIGLGKLDGRTVSFQLGNPVSGEEMKYNDNVLFVDNVMTPLPPVRITRPDGVAGAWVIQDTESMVDLVFTPISDSIRHMSAFVVRTSYHTVYGSFEGVLLTASGEKITLRGFPGVGKKILLRI